MSKILINFLVTFILAFALSFFMGWYSVMIAGFLVALIIPLKRLAVFFVPFLAILIFWAAYSFVLSNANDFILAERIAILLPLGGNPYLLILVTGIIGGLVSGVSAVFGKQLLLAFRK